MSVLLKSISTVSLLAFVCATASAQSVSRSALNAYNNNNIVDNPNGAITGQIVNTMNNQIINSMMVQFDSNILSGSGSLNVISNPSIQQSWSGANVLDSININVVSANATVAEAASIIRMTSSTGAACGNTPLCFKIALGTEMTMNPGSDNGYAHNDVLTINSGVGNFSGTATETDMNNHNQDYPLFNQSGFTGALAIAHNFATDDSAFPISAFNYFGTLAVSPHFAAHAGLYFIGATLLKDYTLFDWTSSTNLIFDQGTHTTGINLAGGTYSGNAWQAPGSAISGIGQANFLSVQTPNYFLISAASTLSAPTPTSGQSVNFADTTNGDVHRGNGSTYDESFATSAGIAFGVQHASLNVNALGNFSIAGTLGLTPVTWTDTQTCIAGQITADAGFIYVCTAANTVKRAALTTF